MDRRSPGRPRKTILDRVLEASFDPSRKAHRALLAEDELPREPPQGVAPALWKRVLLSQANFRLADKDKEQKAAAHAFAALISELAESGEHRTDHTIAQRLLLI